MQHIAGLAPPILDPGVLVPVIGHVLEINDTARRQVNGTGGHPHDAHRVLGRCGGALLQHGMQELRQEEVADVVGAELQLVALGGLGARGGHHDAGIEPEHVEARLEAQELLGGLGNGAQVGEVEGQEDEVALGLGVLLPERGDGRRGLVLGPRGQVDFCVVLVQDGGELLAYAA